MVTLQEKDVIEWILGRIDIEELTKRIKKKKKGPCPKKMKEAYSKGSQGLAKFMGQKIRQLRASKQMSHKEFSTMLGTCHTGSAPWEAGVRPPPLTALYMAICIFKLKPSEFLPTIEEFAKWSGLE